MSEWRPIAEAPKDGTRILAVMGDSQPFVCRWEQIGLRGHWTVYLRHADHWIRRLFAAPEFALTVEPTLWTDCPQPPKDNDRCQT